MKRLKVKRLREGAKLPTYATEGSVGLDLYACLEKEVLIKPMEWKLIPTGIAIELPKGYEAQIRPRSGLALKYGITLLNSPGTVDWDYRGEIKVILMNLGKEPFKVKNGDRIAQMVIVRVERLEPTFTEELSFTRRGEGGFGSTGL